ARLADGRVMMLLRGSNAGNPSLPGWRWVSYSTDGGWHWTTPQPWTYTSGRPFFSPSACSQLLRHSNGRLYWIGHITPANPRGNRPRYPIVVRPCRSWRARRSHGDRRPRRRIQGCAPRHELVGRVWIWKAAIPGM